MSAAADATRAGGGPDERPASAGHWLDDAVTRMVARSRLPVDAAARLLLDTLVAAAVERMRNDDPSTARRDEALGNLRTLFDDLTQQSRILRFDVIPAPNVVNALERLCPLWPFCAGG